MSGIVRHFSGRPSFKYSWKYYTMHQIPYFSKFKGFYFLVIIWHGKSSLKQGIQEWKLVLWEESDMSRERVVQIYFKYLTRSPLKKIMCHTCHYVERKTGIPWAGALETDCIRLTPWDLCVISGFGAHGWMIVCFRLMTLSVLSIFFWQHKLPEKLYVMWYCMFT